MSRPRRRAHRRGVTGVEHDLGELFDLVPIEHSYWLPGHGLNGMRLILAGMPLSRRTISRLASSSESLTPLSMTYSR